MFKIIIIVLIVTVIGLTVFANLQSDIQSTSTSLNSSATNANYLTLSISGEIFNPGTYYLDYDSYLSSLVDASGGLTSNADELCYDLDYELEDGQSFYIAPKYDTSDACSYEPIKKVNINEDDKEELMSVNGIGSTIASAIISYREEEEFERLEDIKNVSGVGNATFEKIKNYITLK